MADQDSNIRHPQTLAQVRVHQPAPTRRIVIAALFVLLHSICLQWCVRSSGQPYAVALEKLKENNRKHHKNQTKPEDRPPDDPLPAQWSPNEWAGAALFFSISAHILFHFVCHWRVRFRARMLFTPATHVSEKTWFEVTPHAHRGQAALVPTWRTPLSGRLCIEFQRQRYEFFGKGSGWGDSDDESNGDAADERSLGELRLMTCPVSEPLSEYLSGKGLTEDQIEELRDKFGSNICRVATPTFWACYREQLATPLIVFQVFIAMLWAADNFLGYTLVQIVMVLMFESTSVFQRIHMLKTLNNMGSKPYDVKVYRQDEWVTLSTADLLPGDLLQLALEKSEEPPANAEGGDKAAAAAAAEATITDIVPCDCVLLSGETVANEATLTGESVPQMKDALPLEDRILDLQGEDRCHCLFSGSRMLRTSAGAARTGAIAEGADAAPQARPLPETPDGGCLCRVLRTGFYSSQGEMLQVIEFSRMKVSGDSREVMIALLMLLCCALVAAGYVLKKGLEDGDRTPHELIIKCVIILTSVVPRGLPMQMSLAVNTSLMSLMKAGVYCTEPFRVPMAGKITHCMFDKTGTLTTDTLVPAGVVNGYGACSREAWKMVEVRMADPQATLVLAACHSLVADAAGSQLTGDPVEVAAIRGVGWHYDPETATAHRGDWEELEKQIEKHEEEIQKINAQAETAQTPAQKSAYEQQRSEKEKSIEQAKLTVEAEKARGEEGPTASVKIVHRFQFLSKLQRMSVIADVEAREGTETLCSGRYALVKGSPEALRPLLAEESAPSWFDTAYVEMAEKGQRVLALAIRQLPADSSGDATKLLREDVESQLEFVGFIAFECQLRSDTPLVIGSLTDSAHKIAMVTGDAPLTALHVARECGIAHKSKPTLLLKMNEGDGHHAWVVAAGEHRGEPGPAGSVAELVATHTLAATEDTLDRLEETAPELWDEAVNQIAIFARMTPNGKAKVIRAVQKRGLFVLMCGDGGNDAGALKQADAGLALLAGHGAVNTAKASDEPEAAAAAAAAVADGTQEGTPQGAVLAKPAEIKGAEELLNARQKELQQKTKDIQKGRSAHLKQKQKDLQALQQKWLEEEIQAKQERGENGMFAQAAAVKTVLGRFTNELRREMREFDVKHGNIYDDKGGGEAGKPKDPMAALEEMKASMPKGMGLAQPGEASVAAPFTSRTPSVRGCVDLVRLGRSTLLSALQQQQVMMMNAIINAFVLSVISLEGSRRSERQLIASEWLITAASLSFSYASPCDRMHPIRPLRSLFHPAIFLSMLGQAAIHLFCLYFAVTMAREVMNEESLARKEGWEGPSIKDVKEFWRRQKLIRRGIIAKQEVEEKNWYEEALDMWLSPFLPNLMNTVVFLVETAQTVAVLMVNYKGQPWMKGVLENRPLFFSLFVIVGASVAAAWEFSPEANELLHLSPFPSDNFRWKVMGLVAITLLGTLLWDRLCCAIFARENFRATLEAASRTTFKNDIYPLIVCAIKVALGFGGLAVIGTMQHPSVKAIPVTATS